MTSILQSMIGSSPCIPTKTIIGCPILNSTQMHKGNSERSPRDLLKLPVAMTSCLKTVPTPPRKSKLLANRFLRTHHSPLQMRDRSFNIEVNIVHQLLILNPHHHISKQVSNSIFSSIHSSHPALLTPSHQLSSSNPKRSQCPLNNKQRKS